MITLVLGGARSGKSEVAEELAAGLGERVTYVATCVVTDADMAARVEVHRDRRPADWLTVEAPGPDLPTVLDRVDGPVLLDSLTTWVASAPDFDVDADGLCAALRKRAGATVVVSDEVGLGVSPSTAVGNRFRDALGVLNQRVAEMADDAVLVVAGRRLRLT